NLIFNANIDNYSHELKITYKDGFSESVDILENNKKLINKRFLNDHSIIFDFVPVVNRIVNKIEYFMNGHLCALWEDRTND
ncbi:MAG: hypothetical protein ACOX7H_09475, partial [Bacillota bacterium]